MSKAELILRALTKVNLIERDPESQKYVNANFKIKMCLGLGCSTEQFINIKSRILAAIQKPWKVSVTQMINFIRNSYMWKK